MSAWVGQYCLYVRDLERSVKASFDAGKAEPRRVAS